MRTSLALFALMVFSWSLSAMAQGTNQTTELMPDCSVAAGSLPDSHRPIGQEDLQNPIRHVIVIMQENHSFDNYFGKLDETGYHGIVDGLNNAHQSSSYHEQSFCFDNLVHDWDTLHRSWNHGKNDGFPAGRPFGYYDESDLNFYYSMAKRFAIGDRYFGSVMSPTFPNRMFMMAATSDGETDNSRNPKFWFRNHRTIFDVMSENHVSWKYYFGNLPAFGLLPRSLFRNLSHLHFMKKFKKDLAKADLPSVIFLDHSLFLNEEPPKNPQLGQQAVAQRIKDLVGSQYWKDSVVFFTYDEDGGFYDHVAPPRACAPDDTPAKLKSTQPQGDFTLYGFRVPFIAISPYVKSHYVSHQIFDHTSILKYIETKFNLPALSRRDANANGFEDIFDYEHPNFEVALPEALLDQGKSNMCKEAARPNPQDYLNPDNYNDE